MFQSRTYDSEVLEKKRRRRIHSAVWGHCLCCVCVACVIFLYILPTRLEFERVGVIETVYIQYICVSITKIQTSVRTQDRFRSMAQTLWVASWGELIGLRRHTHKFVL